MRSIGWASTLLVAYLFAIGQDFDIKLVLLFRFDDGQGVPQAFVFDDSFFACIVFCPGFEYKPFRPMT